jgi:multisubunit Na+/H+ antiporter MnhC subunit
MYIPTAVISIIAGTLILLRPALLNYIIALYLILVGILGLLDQYRGIAGL